MGFTPITVEAIFRIVTASRGSEFKNFNLYVVLINGFQ